MALWGKNAMSMALGTRYSALGTRHMGNFSFTFIDARASAFKRREEAADKDGDGEDEDGGWRWSSRRHLPT